jgi:hypothetical protein
MVIKKNPNCHFEEYTELLTYLKAYGTNPKLSKLAMRKIEIEMFVSK